MAQKYRLVKADSSGSQYSPSSTSSGSRSDMDTTQQLAKSQKRARFWKIFSIVLFAAAAAAGILFWMHSVSGSLAHVRHSLAQQSQANAKQNHQLSQIQSSLHGIHQQLTSLGHQIQTYFIKLWSAITQSH